ncbi:MAG: patatin-like phospholipase family protein [Proteobacteria bacterium]|nr:patatin-like phospholipase family protein [Pseudomonadota bacterium]MBU1742153.1 patatin-like phospholipase family protein [Pseudomonadota bacterium]
MSYQSVVFAGGGNRCWWQAGFWEEWAPAIGLSPRVVAATSAGASMACLVLADRTQSTLKYFLEATAANQGNVYLENVVSRRPVFPHLAIYRRGIRRSLDRAALERLQRGPELRVLLARPPRWSGPFLGALAGFCAYNLEKRLRSPLHPQFALRLGFRAVVARVNDCRSPGEVAELLIGTSASPPVVPPWRWQGHPVLDGGLVDNVPVGIIRPEERPTLVLLTRRYSPEKLANHSGLTYIQPSRDISIGRWDYTNPQGIREAFDLGRRDGRRFLSNGPEALQR